MRTRPSLWLSPLVLGLTCCTSAEKNGVSETRGPINDVCPRSGKEVVDDSLTEYRGYVVGFCNQHCRDDFAAHVDERPADREYFDAVIERVEVRDGNTSSRPRRRRMESPRSRNP
jgi:hypothetical protein